MLAALQQAIDAASIALAPSLDLSLVPSAFIIAASTAYISDASRQIHQLKHQTEQYHDQQFIWVFRYRIYSE